MNAFIDEHRARGGVEPICSALQVAPSAYRQHAARQRNPALLPARARRDAQLLPQVQRVYDQNLRVYGADKVWRQLRREGTAVARCTVERLMSLIAAPAVARADAVTDWNANAGAAALAACTAPNDNPLHESRLYVMLHLAVHDALNAIQRRSRPYAYDAVAPAGTSAEAAVAAAAHTVLVSQIALIGAPFPAQCISAGIARAEADYASALAAVADGTAKTQGMALGQAAAAVVIAHRANDGSTTASVDPNFTQGSLPGAWRFTPGSPPIAFASGWGQVKPFVLQSADQFRPGPPLAVDCAGKPLNNASGCRKYAADVAEVKRLGGDGVVTPGFPASRRAI